MYIQDSKILTESETSKLHSFLGEGKQNEVELKLLYRGSRDGFASSDFHRLCDGKGPTLTLIQTPQGAVFGGYASVSWTSAGNYASAPGSFLFTLRNSRNLSPQTFALKKPQYAMYCSANRGPSFGVFGGNHDLYISSRANSDLKSYSKLGNSYALPAGCTDDLLAGASKFTVSEVEVFGRRSLTLVYHCRSECSSCLFRIAAAV